MLASKFRSLCRLLTVLLCSSQPPAAQQRGSAQLLDAMMGDGMPSAGLEPQGMPVGFLDDWAERFAEENLSDMLQPTGWPLPLSAFLPPLS